MARASHQRSGRLWKLIGPIQADVNRWALVFADFVQLLPPNLLRLTRMELQSGWEKRRLSLLPRACLAAPFFRSPHAALLAAIAAAVPTVEATADRSLGCTVPLGCVSKQPCPSPRTMRGIWWACPLATDPQGSSKTVVFHMVVAEPGQTILRLHRVVETAPQSSPATQGPTIDPDLQCCTPNIPVALGSVF